MSKETGRMESLARESQGKGRASPSMNILSYKEVIDVLAFFAATKNYGYVDAVANALDPITALDAVINAVRDYISTCLGRTPPSPEDLGAYCPLRGKEAKEKLSKTLERFESTVTSLGSSGDLVFFLKRIAARAYAESLRLVYEKDSGRPEGGEGE